MCPVCGRGGAAGRPGSGPGRGRRQAGALPAHVHHPRATGVQREPRRACAREPGSSALAARTEPHGRFCRQPDTATADCSSGSPRLARGACVPPVWAPRRPAGRVPAHLRAQTCGRSQLRAEETDLRWRRALGCPARATESPTTKRRMPRGSQFLLLLSAHCASARPGDAWHAAQYSQAAGLAARTGCRGRRAPAAHAAGRACRLHGSLTPCSCPSSPS